MRLISLHSLETNRKGEEELVKIKSTKRITFSFMDVNDWHHFEMKEKYGVYFGNRKQGNTVIDSVSIDSDGNIRAIHLKRTVLQIQRIRLKKYINEYETRMTFTFDEGLTRYSYLNKDSGHSYNAVKIE